jgi:hypothetical protein
MSNLWWEHLTPEERLLAEQAVLQHRALREACAAAPDGKVLAIAERLAVDQGRAATRLQLQTALQNEAAEAEKKGAQVEVADSVTSPAPTADARRARSSRRRVR